MCAGVCCEDEDEILEQIVSNSFEAEALTYDCCWEEICRVRGRNFHAVSLSCWTELCRERAYAIQEYGRNAGMY